MSRIARSSIAPLEVLATLDYVRLSLGDGYARVFDRGGAAGRDVTSGLVVLAMLLWGSSHNLGIVLLIEALIPIGDMSLVLAARGSTRRAFGIHGLTAALMIAGAVPLIMGMA